MVGVRAPGIEGEMQPVVVLKVMVGTGVGGGLDDGAKASAGAGVDEGSGLVVQSGSIAA
jgi:hypothetical protein